MQEKIIINGMSLNVKDLYTTKSIKYLSSSCILEYTLDFINAAVQIQYAWNGTYINLYENIYRFITAVAKPPDTIYVTDKGKDVLCLCMMMAGPQCAWINETGCKLFEFDNEGNGKITPPMPLKWLDVSFTFPLDK